MVLELQFKIKNNPTYLNYLRTHSYWYKKLNRDYNTFPLFEEEVKTNLRLKTTDKISKTLDTVEMLSTLINTLK